MANTYTGISQGPARVFAAPVDTTRPSLPDATPASRPSPAVPWQELGAVGDRSITEEGITFNLDDSISETFALGTTLPVFAFTEQEMQEVSFQFLDFRPEILARLSGQSTTETAAASGVPGVRRVNTQRGLGVQETALLIWHPSPYRVDRIGQLYLPRVFVKARGEVQFSKSSPAIVPVTFGVLFHETLGGPVVEAVFAEAL